MGLNIAVLVNLKRTCRIRLYPQKMPGTTWHSDITVNAIVAALVERVGTAPPSWRVTSC